MKREDQKLLDYILGLWVSYQSKHESIESIIREGPTVGGKWLENKGDFPQASSFNIDSMAGKVDKMRKFNFSPDENLAYMIIISIPDKFRNILVKHREKKHQNNSETNARWTHADIAALLCYQLERYHEIRERLSLIVINAFNQTQKRNNKKAKRYILQLNHGNDRLCAGGESCHK
jgi:hypothetical protein